MNIQTEKSIQNTYINPIVLPDYPCLEVKSVRKLSDWGRGDKKLVSEGDLMRESGVPEAEIAPMEGVFSPGYGCVPESDVRATADPSCYCFDGRYYLYVTSGMVYDSDDLVHWTPHYDETWLPISAPMAPTVEKWNGKFYAAANRTPLFVSDSPLGPWEKVGEWTLPDGREMEVGDVMIFKDDDNRCYLYFGLGVSIFGAEMDPENPNHLKTFPKLLFRFDPHHWWERFGGNNEDWKKGFIEGSWMVKLNGRYYLTYSCSGTEYYNYAMGAYISDSPLGDFTLMEGSPFSRSRQGFVRGGGHGSIVRGPKDTLWCFYTIPVCVDHNFERRIGMDPVEILPDGTLHARTGCEVPQYNPGVLDEPGKGNEAGLVPLTLFKPSKCSSYKSGHRALYAFDEAMHTWWEPEESDKAPTIEVLLQAPYNVSAVRLMWKDAGLFLDGGIVPGPYRYVIEGNASAMGGDWFTLVDASDNQTDLAVDYRTFEAKRAVRLRMRLLDWPKGIRPALLNFTAFGIAPEAE